MDGHLSFDLCRKHDCSFSGRAFRIASTDPNSRTPCWEMILKPLEQSKHTHEDSHNPHNAFSSRGTIFKVHEGNIISLPINCHLSVVRPFLVSNIIQLCLLSCKFLYESSSKQPKHTNTIQTNERTSKCKQTQTLILSRTETLHLARSLEGVAKQFLNWAHPRFRPAHQLRYAGHESRSVTFVHTWCQVMSNANLIQNSFIFSFSWRATFQASWLKSTVSLLNQ